jgi:hypothetical protein
MSIGTSFRIFCALGRNSGGKEKSSSTSNPEHSKGRAAAVIERMITWKLSRRVRPRGLAMNGQNVVPFDIRQRLREELDQLAGHGRLPGRDRAGQHNDFSHGLTLNLRSASYPVSLPAGFLCGGPRATGALLLAALIWTFGHCGNQLNSISSGRISPLNGFFHLVPVQGAQLWGELQ